MWQFLWQKKWFVLVGLLILVLIGWRIIAGKNKNGTETTEIKRGEVAEELILSGEINADEYANMAFGTSGRITSVLVHEGSIVKKGQTMATIDATGASADLQIADADLRDKAATLDRVYDDLKGKETTESLTEKETRTDAETAKDKAVFTHIKAQNILSYTSLRAPFDGVVTYIANPFAGVNVLSTEKQVTVVNPATIYFDVTADQSEVIDIKDDQQVTIILDSISDEGIKGVVDFVSYAPLSGDVGAVYKVKIRLIQSVDVGRVRIGMTGDVKFVMDKKEDVLYVPSGFVKSDKNGRHINLGRKNNKKYVEVGIEGEEFVEITGEGIKEGMTIYD